MNFVRHIHSGPTISTNEYTAGEVMGGCFHFQLGQSEDGVIRAVSIVDVANQKKKIWMYLFDEEPTPQIDKTQLNLTVECLKRLIGVVKFSVGDYETVNSHAFQFVGGGEEEGTGLAPMALYYAASDGRLYAYAVAQQTVTYTASGDLLFGLSMANF